MVAGQAVLVVSVHRLHKKEGEGTNMNDRMFWVWILLFFMLIILLFFTVFSFIGVIRGWTVTEARGSWQCIEEEKQCLEKGTIVRYRDSCDGFFHCYCDFDYNRTTQIFEKFCFAIEEECLQEET